ncbi:uncharacterized protein LOC105093611 [Camelus dromedarius]|uniref:uncharacterized protein LOC105093611 n=1 Tax=Camelus dromedarius TaxID=9838 RepID=UPI00126398CB|nr:uncharacterized protein LOC105093611 [Camelus dromedarius]
MSSQIAKFVRERLLKQASGKQVELDMLYYQNISRLKKRIVHAAKFDALINKETISPHRGPVPPLISHAGLLQAQQQAVQMKAAVKGGQAFVAVTSEQKKNACPASQTQRKASEESSRASNSLHVDVVLLKENPTAKPNRSHIPVKSVAAFPVKAKIEEKAIYELCGSQNMYMNIAINTLKKLRDQDVSGSSDDKTTGLKTNEKENVLTGIILYRHLKDYLLTEEQLHENNYPQPNPDKPGSVLLNPGMTGTLVNDASHWKVENLAVKNTGSEGESQRSLVWMLDESFNASSLTFCFLISNNEIMVVALSGC